MPITMLGGHSIDDKDRRQDRASLLKSDGVDGFKFKALVNAMAGNGCFSIRRMMCVSLTCCFCIPFIVQTVICEETAK